ncbi:metal-dependent hydrolase [Ammonifex thiophilus]|uniref:Metal-dependent hydrolase n=1 Tax=Ammonifex thiophilus TaxID=444093 RepID=A0A3D8P320_9THEO|nr:metal-dependent hydrolase [Ammonifex thiophilus]RDV81791.1 metal-dependent hydrolase [Ammonifex thiophilus]
MMYDTHLAGGVLAGAAVAAALSLPGESWVAAMLVGGVAALLPDVDHGRAALNQALRKGAPLAGDAVNAALRGLLGHRAVTHSLAAAAVLTTALRFLWPALPGALLLSFLLGYLSHLALDALTPGGVWWLWPFDRRRGVPLVATGGPAEKFLVRPFLWLCVLLLAGRKFLV